MKMMNVICGLLILLFSACNTSKETPNGMKFKVVKEGNGVLAKPNEVLVFNFRLVDSKDSVWSDTFEEGMPGAVMIQDTSATKDEDGMMQMLRMVSPGDSIIVDFKMKEFFENMLRRPIPPGIDSTLSLSYQFKIDSITTVEKYQAQQVVLIEKKQKNQLKKDTEAIDAFLASKNITAEKTESGLRYVITSPGTGENGQPGQTASVAYAGYTLAGIYFDTNIKPIAAEKGLYNPGREPYAPYDVTIDQSSVIKGWHEALKLMNKGSKATFYIPSGLGYGPQQRSEVIKPNTVLVFDLEMVDLK